MPRQNSLPQYPLVTHTITFLKAITTVIIGGLSALYSITPAVRFMQIAGSEVSVLNKTVASFAGLASGIITIGQVNHLIKELKKYRDHDPENLSFLRTVGVGTKIGIFLLALSTLIGAFLLAMIQLRETQDIYKFEIWSEILIALNNALFSELPQVIFGLGQASEAKKLAEHIFKVIARAQPATRRDRSASGSSNDSGDSSNAFGLYRDFAPPPQYPNASFTLPATLISTLALVTLLICYIDEYFRMLPEGLDDPLGKIFAGISIPGIFCIILLGFASVSSLLKSSSQFTHASKFNAGFSILFSVAASCWEFLMGTESGRNNFTLGITLGSVSMFARALINVPFAYELLTDFSKLLSEMMSSSGEYVSKKCSELKTFVNDIKAELDLRHIQENWPAAPGDDRFAFIPQ